jgi:CHAD domain-containing protein
MAAYQRCMGHIQDAEVLLEFLDRFARKCPAAAAGLGEFRLTVERLRARLVREFLRSADQLSGFWPLDVGATQNDQALSTNPS